MSHIVLCGDSIFDNRSYVGTEEPDVVQQLRARIDGSSRATLLAIDGCLTAEVPSQFRELPEDATHLFVSSGGNDALGRLSLLEHPAQSVGEVLYAWAEVAESFERIYGGMVESALQYRVSTVLCSIYYPVFDRADLSRVGEFASFDVKPDSRRRLQRLACTALAFFNDVIIRTAVRNGLPLLDLRYIFEEDGDYANPIEPSAQGGEKLTAVMARVASEHDFSRRTTVVYRQ